MIRPLIRTINLLSTYISLRRDISSQKAFIRKTLSKDIARFRKDNDGTLDEEDFFKIRNYYGFGVPAIVGEGFCTLRGIRMTSKERIASTYLGALTGLYDDFFDKTKLSGENILAMMKDPASCAAKTSLEKLFIHFLTTARQHIPDLVSFNDSFKEVFLAQKESLEQQNEEITAEIIRKITIRKGGRSLLFYRSAFEHPLRKGEAEAIYEIGGLMQFGNDIFDVHKDQSQDIKTLLTVNEHIQPVRAMFMDQMDKAFSLVKGLPYDESDIRKYLHKLFLGMSRCLVCLDQLQRLQKRNADIFSPGAFKRNDLICDMEKLSNLLKSAYYYTCHEL